MHLCFEAPLWRPENKSGLTIIGGLFMVISCRNCETSWLNPVWGLS